MQIADIKKQPEAGEKWNKAGAGGGCRGMGSGITKRESEKRAIFVRHNTTGKSRSRSRSSKRRRACSAAFASTVRQNDDGIVAFVLHSWHCWISTKVQATGTTWWWGVPVAGGGVTVANRPQAHTHTLTHRGRTLLAEISAHLIWFLPRICFTHTHTERIRVCVCVECATITPLDTCDCSSSHLIGRQVAPLATCKLPGK